MRYLFLLLPLTSLVNTSSTALAQYYPYPPPYYTPGYYPPPYYYPPTYYRPPPPPPSPAYMYRGGPPYNSSANCGTPDQFKPCTR
jgi:hypothetical protein